MNLLALTKNTRALTTIVLMLAGIFLSVITLITLVWLAHTHQQFKDALLTQQSLQDLLQVEIKKLQDIQIEMQKPSINTPEKIPTYNDSLTEKFTYDTYLSELTWAFNQSGALRFYQSSVEPTSLVSLHEFLRRLIRKGFTGEVGIAIHVGNFCVAIDNMGIAQLPPASATLGNCMLSNEIYGLERIAEQYQEDIKSALFGLTRDPVHGLRVNITTHINTEAYPERLPSVTIKEWNGIAQANNRIELTLTTNPRNE